MTARISLIPGKTRGHRPRLQMLLHAVAEALRYTVRLAPVPNGGGTPVRWAEQILTSSKP